MGDKIKQLLLGPQNTYITYMVTLEPHFVLSSVSVWTPFFCQGLESAW